MESNVLDLISQIEILVDLDMHWKSVLNCNEKVEELIKKTRLCVKKIIHLKSKEIVLVLAHKEITYLTKDTMQLYVVEMKKLAHFFTDPSTGGSIALALAAIGIGLGSINWNSESSCRENAKKIRRKIRNIKEKRDTYKTQKKDLEDENRINRQAIDNLQSRIQTMQSAADVFDKGTRSTDGMTSAMTPVIFKFEQMDRESERALQETERYVKDTLARKQNEEYRSSARDDIEFTAEEELQILHKKMGYVDDNIHRLLVTSALLTSLLELAENTLDSTEVYVTDKIYVAIDDTSEKSSPYDEELKLLRKKIKRFERKYEQLKPYMYKLNPMIRVFERNMHCAEEIATISYEIDVLSGNLLEAMEQKAEDLAQRREPPVGSVLVQTDINRETDIRLMPTQQLFDFKAKWRWLCRMLLKL